MYFVLEESSWAWDGCDRHAYTERIEQLLDRLDVACERGEGFAASKELQQQEVSGRSLADLLWDPAAGLDLSHDVRERLSAHFSRLRFWDDEEGYLEFEAKIAECDVTSPSAVYVHAHVEQGKAMACLPLPGLWKGPCVVSVQGRAKTLHFVADEPSHRGFFRNAFALNTLDERTAESFAPHAFPDTFFLDGVWGGLRDFEGGYTRVRQLLLHFLAIFDDHGRWVLTDQTGRLSSDEPEPNEKRSVAITSVLIQRRFSRWGFDVAPEKANVREDAACRRARERTLRGQLLYCEWHYKLQGHINRVHFHPPLPESGSKPIVAIFHKHLPLPGDD